MKKVIIPIVLLSIITCAILYHKPVYSKESYERNEYFQIDPNVYCFLLYNNYTHVNDSIKASSKEEIKEKVLTLTGEIPSVESTFRLLLSISGIAASIYLMFFLFKIFKKKRNT